MTTAQTPADIKMLELPEARQYMVGFGPGDIADMFTAEQMQAYALACVEADRKEPCEWHLDDEENAIWESACGESWTFIEGGPKENRVSYCHHCGGKVLIKD